MLQNDYTQSGGTSAPARADDKTPAWGAPAPAASDAPGRAAPKGASFHHLASEVVKNSLASDFRSAAMEWEAFYFDKAERPDSCVCGHPHIIDRYAIRNVNTGAVLWPIGNVCIRHFGDAGLAKGARGVRELTELKDLSAASTGPLALRRGEAGWGSKGRITRNDINLLKRLGALTEGQRWTVARAFNSRRPSSKLLSDAHAIVESEVRPWLASWDGIVR